MSITWEQHFCGTKELRLCFQNRNIARTYRGSYFRKLACMGNSYQTAFVIFVTSNLWYQLCLCHMLTIRLIANSLLGQITRINYFFRIKNKLLVLNLQFHS